MVVWLKVRLSIEPDTGLMTGKSKAVAEKFANYIFVERLRKEGPGTEARVLSFILQSVRGLEHIHILVRDVSDEVVAGWTGKEQPQER